AAPPARSGRGTCPPGPPSTPAAPVSGSTPPPPPRTPPCCRPASRGSAGAHGSRSPPRPLAHVSQPARSCYPPCTRAAAGPSLAPPCAVCDRATANQVGGVAKNPLIAGGGTPRRTGDPGFSGAARQLYSIARRLGPGPGTLIISCDPAERQPATSRSRLLPESEISTSPAASVTTASGKASSALAAGPPSPAKPWVPLPAIE